MSLIRPEAVRTPRVIANGLFVSRAQLLLAVVAERCASFSFCAHSSQHTSTVLPPIVTSTVFAFSSQSQAAQVLSAMTILSINARALGVASRARRWKGPLSESL